MPNYKKFLIVFFLVIFPSFVSSNFAFAQRELEVPIPGLTSTTLPALPDYIVAIFNFSLIMIVIVVLGALIYGGIRYLTSVGSPTAMSNAKDQIYSALLGLIILFSSWIILTTINPELVILGEPPKDIECLVDSDCPGSQLCVARICTALSPQDFPMTLYEDADYQGAACPIGKSDKSIEDLCGAGWNDTISSIKIENPRYVAVIHEHFDFTGKAQLIEINVPKLDAHMHDLTSSITVIRKSGTGRRITIFEDAGFGGREKVFYSSHPNFAEIEDAEGISINNLASSISVERSAIAIIFAHNDYMGGARIIIKDDSNFDTCDDEDYCGGCSDFWELSRCGCYLITNSCWNDKVSSMQIVNGYIVTTLAGRCAGFPDTTCVAEGCEWCPKCSANYEENPWGFDTCVEPGTCPYTCSTNCDGEWCPRCSGFWESTLGADACVLTGTCDYPTCSLACGGVWCPQCSGFWENPVGADACIATGTCDYLTCSLACGGEWCPRCSGYFINQWNADQCVVIGTGCGYTCGDLFVPPRCGADTCTCDAIPCEVWDATLCDCVPTPCC